MRCIIVIVMLCWFGVDTALADAEKFVDSHVAQSLPTTGISSMGYVTVALSLVLALIYGSAWLLRRMRNLSGEGKQSMSVVEAISVGPKERVVLLRVRDKQVLLGVASGRVDMLLDMGKPEDVEQINSDATNNELQRPSFKALLKRSMGLS